LVYLTALNNQNGLLIVILLVFGKERIQVTQVYLEKAGLFCWGFRPKPGLTFCLNTKSKQKSQSASWRTLHSKTYAQLAETVQTCSFVAQTGQFLTPTSLVFRFT